MTQKNEALAMVRFWRAEHQYQVQFGTKEAAIHARPAAKLDRQAGDEMITILSDNGRFKAMLDDTDDGVAVTFWHRIQGDAEHWKLINRQTVDLAFHVACDLAHDTVNALKISPPPAQKRAAFFASSSAELFTRRNAMKPSELIESLKLLVGIQRPAFITGDAGVGKSRIVRQVAGDLGLDLIDVRAVLLDPVDIRGLPHVNGDGRAHWAIPDFLPREGNGLLFLDELNRAPQLVQNACLQLALERQVGEYKLPDGWSVVAAGNPDTHRGVTRMSEALANRFVHLAIAPDLDDWTRWAISADVRPELIAFIRFRPELLHSYDPKSTEKAYPSPRSWEFVSQMLNANPPASIEHALYAGTVGEGPAGELIGFLDVYRQLPSIDGILMNPKKAKVPEEPGALFAVSAALARKSTEGNFDRVMTYADRMPPEWKVYCVKDATARDQRLCDTPAFIKFAAENSDIMG